MAHGTRWLVIRQLDQRFERLRNLRDILQPPKGGWIRTIRRALGMTVSQMAERLHVTPGRITQLEKQEAVGKATLSSLIKAADALDCELIFALLPRDSLESRLRERAAEHSAAAVLEVAHTMALEQQRPSDSALEAQKEAHVEQLLRGPWSRLWKKT